MIAAALVLGALAEPCAAHVANDTESRRLARLPESLRAALAAGLPDTSGLTPAQGGYWHHVGLQRTAFAALLDAAARGDEVAGERAWLAVDATLARLGPRGDWPSVPALAPADDAVATALAVGDLAHALLVVDVGPLRGWFARRATRARPLIVRAAGRLAERAGRDPRAFAGVPESIVLGSALAFAAELDHDSTLAAQADTRLAAALARQTRDGRLGVTPAAQVIATLRLARVAWTFPDARWDDALARAMAPIVANARAPRRRDPWLAVSRGGASGVARERALLLVLDGLDDRPGHEGARRAGVAACTALR